MQKLFSNKKLLNLRERHTETAKEIYVVHPDIFQFNLGRKFVLQLTESQRQDEEHWKHEKKLKKTWNGKFQFELNGAHSRNVGETQKWWEIQTGKEDLLLFVFIFGGCACGDCFFLSRHTTGSQIFSDFSSVVCSRQALSLFWQFKHFMVFYLSHLNTSWCMQQ